MRDTPTRPRRKRLRAILTSVAAAAFAALPLSSSAFAGPGVPGHSHVWGYEASGGLARLLEYNIDPTTSTITPGPFCVPVPSGNGRAVAHDPAAPPQPPFAGGEVLWYQFFGNTGRIFKATLPSAVPPCQPRGSIPFGEGPGPPNQDNIGAFDLDTDDANILWTAGYIDVPATGFPEGGGPYLMLFKVDKTNGQILGRCKSLAGGFANDTLTVANLPTVGKVLLTDFEDPWTIPNILYAVDPASLTGPPAPAPAPDCRIVTTYTTPVGETGIEWGTIPKPTPNPPEESLLATDLFNWFDLDQPPFATARPMGPTGTFIEDISLLSEAACPPGDDDDDNGDDNGRRDDDDDDDDDDDGLTDRNESLFLTLLGNRDSDLDGVVDGNDDSNENGEDDEDEDDDECPDDDDSDGDGVDDEDEDDDEDDD